MINPVFEPILDGRSSVNNEADRTVIFLNLVIDLLRTFPVLSTCRPSFNPSDNEILWYGFWDTGGQIIACTPELRWREEWPNMELRDIDATAVRNGITLRIRSLRLLEKSETVQAFVPRDLNPEHKKFVADENGKARTRWHA